MVRGLWWRKSVPQPPSSPSGSPEADLANDACSDRDAGVGDVQVHQEAGEMMLVILGRP